MGGRRAHVPGAQRPDSPNASRATLTDDCLNWHATADTPPYRWEFTDNGHDFSVAVRARVLSTDAGLNRRLVIAGLGITLAYEEHVRGALARGQLVSVLEEFCVPFPGYYL